MEVKKEPLAAVGTVLQDRKDNGPDASQPGSDLRNVPQLEMKETSPDVVAGTKTWVGIIKGTGRDNWTSVKNNKDSTQRGKL